MKFICLTGLASVLLSVTINVHALDFKSVGPGPAVLCDAPSEKGRKVFIAPRGMPVEVILSYGEWSKVRDVTGDLAWVESKALSPKRMVIVNVANAKIRASADETTAPLFSVNKGVLLELSEPVASGWLRIRHRDGQNGYVKATDVWGRLIHPTSSDFSDAQKQAGDR